MKEILILGFQFISLCFVFGHGDLQERILAVSEKIAKDTANPQLYFKRGHLYQQHEEANKALADYLKAEKLGYREKLLFFRKAEIYLKLGLLQEGIISTKKYLKEDPEDIKIHRLRGDLFIQIGDFDSAIAAYKFVIENTKNLTISKTGLRPINFLQLSEAYVNKDMSLIDSALFVIEDGLSVLGGKIFFLQFKKLEYLKMLGDEENILCQYDYFIDSSKRKEKWFYRKAKYLFSKKKYQEALELLESASLACQNLPLRIQNTKTTKSLMEGIAILKNKINSHENPSKAKRE